MNLTRSTLLIELLTCIALTAASASGQVLFSSFGLGGDSFDRTARIVNNPGATLAIQFVPTVSGTLVSAEIAAGRGVGGSQVYGAVYSDASGQPGVLLDSCYFAGIVSTASIVGAACGSGIALRSGTPYWFALSAPSAGDSFTWNMNTSLPVVPAAQRTAAGSWQVSTDFPAALRLSSSRVSTIRNAISVSAASPGPTILGRPAVFTVTISPTNATGRVTLYDGTAILGTADLRFGAGTVAATFVTPGLHSVRALYGGDFDYPPTLSPVTGHSVSSTAMNGFAPAVTYSVGTEPFGITTGDFNGDGRPDVAVANAKSNNVGILTGRSDGTLVSGGTTAAGTYPISVAAADFNRDGKLDIVTANQLSSNVSVLLGRGDGTFQNAVNYASGNGPQAVAVADFNLDGYADLAVANTGAGTIGILLGNGDGTFRTMTRFTSGAAPGAFAVGDLNADAKADIVVANNEGNNVAVFIGTGDGTFQPVQTIPTGQFPHGVLIADLTGDGKPDVAVANRISNTISLLPGKGDGTFSSTATIATGPAPRLMAFGDFNGDGRNDLAVVGQGNGTLNIFAGSATGMPRLTQTYTVGNTPVAVVATDFNSDGRADLAVTNYSSGTISVLAGAALSTGSVTLQSSANPSTLGREVTVTATVTPITARGTVTFYDGTAILGIRPLVSGKAALSTSAFTPGIRTLRAFYSGDTAVSPSLSDKFQQTVKGILQGGFNSPVAFKVGPTPAAIVSADFNRDGKPDLAVAGGTVATVLLAGSGNSLRQSASFSAGTNLQGIAAGDFNGDGNDDVVTVGNNVLTITLGRGDGTFGTASTYATGGTGARSVVVADFNRDGNADIAVISASGVDGTTGAGGVSLFLGRGDGTLIFTGRNLGAPTAYSGVASDFNGDGIADLAVTSWDSNGILVLLGNGDGTFTGYTLPIGRFTFGIAAIDRANGKSDLYITNWADGTVQFLSNETSSAAPAFAAGQAFRSGGTPTAVVAGDFTGKGRVDLAVTNETSLLVTRDDTSVPGDSYPAGRDPYALTSGDFNSDGVNDLAVVSRLDDTLWVFFGTPGMTNTNSASYSSLRLAPEMIALGQGPNIAPDIVVAAESPWPTSLAGVSLQVTDSEGTSRAAPIYFVAPDSIGYLVPAGTATGTATTTLKTSTGVTIKGSIPIAQTSPGFYTATSDGKGAPAGFWIRVDPAGQQTQGYLFDLDTRAPAAVDLGDPSDQIYLSFYGTGFRNAKRTTLLLQNAPGSFPQVYGFAAAPGYQGLDIINIGPLPANWRGAGDITFLVSFDGVLTNPVTVRMK